MYLNIPSHHRHPCPPAVPYLSSCASRVQVRPGTPTTLASHATVLHSCCRFTYSDACSQINFWPDESIAIPDASPVMSGSEIRRANAPNGGGAVLLR